MLTKVYSDKNNSDNRAIEIAEKSANEKVEMQREVTALQRELYFKTERVIAATNRIDSSRAFDSPATSNKPRPGD